MRIPHLIIAIVCAAMLISACADDPWRKTKIGAATGAVIGGVVGHQVDEDDGAVIGAALGAIAGGAVGNYMDRQQRDLKEKLAAERANQELQIVELPGNALKIGVASDVSFESGSADVKFDGRRTYAKIADVLQEYPETAIHVVGHTDSDGSDAYNQGLSERRADAVASILSAEGVNAQRVLTEGRGESEPIASNATEQGKRRNRRVDIVLKPIVEGNETAAFTPPPYLGA